MDPSGSSPGSLARGLESAWSALSSIIAGVVVWGGIGFWADGVIGTRPVLTIVGVLLGNAAGTYLIYLRYGKEDDRAA